MKFILFSILIFLATSLNAQFTDSTTKFVKIASGGSANKTKDGANFLFNNNLQYNVRKKRTIINSSGSWIYGMLPTKEVTNNDFTITGNINLYRHSPEFYYWGILNYTTSYSLNIKSQGQAGIGVAYNFLNKEKIWLNVSNGFIGELNRIIQGDSAIVHYQTIRNSLRAQFMYKIGSSFTFKTSNLFQPSLEFISDHIISSESEFIYQLWKGLNLNAKFLYNKNSRTKKENLILTYGVGYEIYF